MALTGMQIYKQLPRTNCKKCGFPTCMAFAMQVAAKQKALTDCPEISTAAVDSLSEASAPPMKLVKIGTGDKAFEIGQETVMFRHEEKFHRPCGISIRISSSLTDNEAADLIEKVNSLSFLRVGSSLEPKLYAVEIEGNFKAGERAKLAAEKSTKPIILLGKDPVKMEEALSVIKEKKPLIHGADAANIEAFAKIAAAAKVPMTVTGTSPEELADLTDRKSVV